MSWLKRKLEKVDTNEDQDFLYLDKNAYYFDSACQNLRPQSVIDAQNSYFYEFNSCGGRVKYPWGEKVDKTVNQTRKELLKLVNKNEKDYDVAFGLNSTHLMNLILLQLKPSLFDQIITTDIEHNSVFLPSIVWSKKYSKPRIVLERQKSGTVNIEDLKNVHRGIFIANTTSNIDGRILENLTEICAEIRQKSGLVLLDSCQTLGHDYSILQNCDFDACFGSGHKMYAPSVGFVIFRKDLIDKLDIAFIGGSTVTDTRFDEYDLIQDSNELYAVLESGLQNYSAIVGLNEAILWSNNNQKERLKHEQELSNYLYDKLKGIQNITILNQKPSSIVSIYSTKIDSHKLGTILAGKGIMCRVGYHCCHYYLKNKMEYPPLLRISLGFHNTKHHIDYLIQNLEQVISIW